MHTSMKPSASNKGQALVEFAIVVLVFPVIMFGLFDFGRIFQTKLVITNAAREGARFLVRNPEDSLDSYQGTIDAALRAAQSSAITLLPGNVIVTPCIDTDSPPDGCDSGTNVQVGVTKSYSFFFGDFLTGPILMASSARMLIP